MKVGKLIGKATNAGEGEDGEPNFDWEDVSAQVSVIMKDKSRWNAIVQGFGWQSVSGSRDDFEARNGEALILACLPETSCSFEVYRYGRSGIAINNAHHDKPTGGEWYYITPAKV